MTDDTDRVRRHALRTLASLTICAALPGVTAAQAPVSFQAAPRDWSGRTPLAYPDPDIIALEPRFRRYIQFNAPLQRLHTGTLWAEGPAWNGVGRYLVWSDIPADTQMRWIEDDGRVTRFRSPSGYSNGNTFDREGRQLVAEHGGRRVVRYEPDGTVTIIAERFRGKRLNSPNDLVVHPDGSIWFTDPSFGIRGSYEGNPGESETHEAVYRVDAASRRVDLVTDDVTQPNGLCFSPDYSRLYVADSGTGAIHMWDVDGARLRNARAFARIALPDGGRSVADGIRCDTDGNLWAGARPGVVILAPDGTVIGMIRLPEQCANVCFGGAKRNRLFMTASQSLFAIHVAARGAHTC